MPRRIDWRETAVAAEAAEADEQLAALKSYDINKSNTMVCTVCGGAEPHKMRYRLLECSTDTCYDASDMKCAWRGKLLTCLQTHLISIYEFGEHTTDAAEPKRIKLTETQKAFCREMTENHLRPMRIRHALSRKFSTPLDALPSLKAVQNFVNHYARTYLENHDRVDELRKWIHARNYTGAEEITQPYTFGWELDGEGKPVVGNGSDERPFIIGISTKALILRMLLPPDRFILHIDATYKMNYREYPVVVIGVSDRSRGFHVVALFIVSQETQPVFEAVLRSLCRMFYWITHKELIVIYAMADADQAQYNALQSVFGWNPHFHPLMCFFHVMEKVQKAIKSSPSLVAAAVVRDVYDLHFARSQTEFMQLREHILKPWNADPMLLAFSQYMTGQWLYGRFCLWQVFLTPPGYASTNNPAETFNALLKRDYTLRRRLKMGALLKELSNCCQDQSANTRQFRFDVVPASTLVRRVSELLREKLIGLSGSPIPSAACAGGDGVVGVVSFLAKRIVVAPNRRTEEDIAVSAQMGSNYARMEVKCQPWCGWQVDVKNLWCGCNYFFAFGTCVHLLFALRVTAQVDSSGRGVLVSRKKRKRTDTSSTNVGGRPPNVGPALSLM